MSINGLKTPFPALLTRTSRWPKARKYFFIGSPDIRLIADVGADRKRVQSMRGLGQTLLVSSGDRHPGACIGQCPGDCAPDSAAPACDQHGRTP